MQLGFRLIRDKVLNPGEPEFRYFIILELEDFLLFNDLFQLTVEPVDIAAELVYVGKRSRLTAGWNFCRVRRQLFGGFRETGDQFVATVPFESGVLI